MWSLLNEGLFVDPTTDAKQALNELSEAKIRIEGLTEKATRYAGYTELLEISRQPVDSLKKAKVSLNQKTSSWKLVAGWRDLLYTLSTQKVGEIDFEDAMNYAESIEDDSASLGRDDPVIKELIDSIAAWKKRFDILERLTSPDLRERHRQSMSKLVGPDVQSVLLGVLVSRLDEQAESILSVSNLAKGEAPIDDQLDRIKACWKEKILPISNVIRGTPEIGSLTIIMEDLADHIVTVESLKDSEFTGDIAPKVDLILRELKTIQEVVLMLLKFQNRWLSFISSNDIQAGSIGVKKADRFWRELLRRIHEQAPSFIDATHMDSDLILKLEMYMDMLHI